MPICFFIYMIFLYGFHCDIINLESIDKIAFAIGGVDDA